MAFWKRKKSKKEMTKERKPDSPTLNNAKNQELNKDMNMTLVQIQGIFQKDADFSTRKFQLFEKTPAAVLYFSSLTDKETINRDIIRCLQAKPSSNIGDKPLTKAILEDYVYFCQGVEEKQLDKIFNGLLQGKTVVLIQGESKALLFDTFKPEKRSIAQPETERVLRGARDGFIEQMQSNISLLRYRLPVPEFRVIQTEAGTRTKTKIAICYLDDIASDELVKEVENRLKDIDIDGILDAGYIESFIQDNPRSPFPQVQNTERPDKTIGNILEGRVAILVDGSPFALIVPAVFNQFYQSSEDYNERFLSSSITRIVRLIALIFSLTFSSLYVTVLSFHPEVLSAQFMVAAASGRAGVPVPVALEVLLMEAAMEILREATIRMPAQVASALSIVGVLVIGQAAVQAGFVSPITVVIIAMSSIGSFATPSYNVAIAFRLLRFPLIILAGTLGLLGLTVGIMFVINHMLSLRSYGVPYLTPISPWNYQGMKDSFIRAPLRWLKERPVELDPKNVRRVDSGEKKGPTNVLEGNKGGDSDEKT